MGSTEGSLRAGHLWLSRLQPRWMDPAGDQREGDEPANREHHHAQAKYPDRTYGRHSLVATQTARIQLVELLDRHPQPAPLERQVAVCKYGSQIPFAQEARSSRKQRRPW